MTKVQNKLLDLLNEVDKVCEKKNLNYYLIDQTVLGAVNKNTFYSDCCELKIAMTTKHYAKFAEYINKKKANNRVLESIENNNKVSPLVIRYGDINSTLVTLPLETKLKYPNIAIEIHLICFKPETRKPKRYFEDSLDFLRFTDEKLGNIKKLSDKFRALYYKTKSGIRGRDKIAAKIFKKWLKLFGKNKNAEKISIGNLSFSYSSALLEGTSEVTLEGKTYPTFNNVKSYLTTKYGASYAKVTPTYLKASSTALASANVPCLEFIELLEKNGVKAKKMKKNYEKYLEIQKKVTEYNAIINKYYNIVDRTQKRYELYEHYMPMKEEIVELHLKGDYRALKPILKPYRSALQTFKNKGLGLCFDKEIFEITQETLEIEGWSGYNKTIRSLVPEKHWKPISLLNYKGENID